MARPIISQQIPAGKEKRVLRLLLALAATVALGLASRLYPLGWHFYDKVLGDFFYPVAAYLVLAMLLPRLPRWLIGLIAFGCCLAVELFKVTDIPADHQDVFLVRWFLGMNFNVVNLGYYSIGAALATFADWATAAQPRIAEEH